MEEGEGGGGAEREDNVIRIPKPYLNGLLSSLGSLHSSAYVVLNSGKSIQYSVRYSDCFVTIGQHQLPEKDDKDPLNASKGKDAYLETIKPSSPKLPHIRTLQYMGFCPLNCVVYWSQRFIFQFFFVGAFVQDYDQH